MVSKDMDDLVDQPLEQILGTPEVRHVFADIKLGVTVPTPPVLIVQAVHDQLDLRRDIDELADTYQSGGASVTYHRDLFSEHLLLHPMSAPMTLRWLRDRFDGKPLSEHMVRTKWPTLLNPITYVGMAGWRRSPSRWSPGGRSSVPRSDSAIGPAGRRRWRVQLKGAGG